MTYKTKNKCTVHIQCIISALDLSLVSDLQLDHQIRFVYE